ncbi:glycosyltransferase family 2 protein [Spirosoma taeanense]|uniref:Glycosyltransferase family 2 protein n=1 Tax=Spirosoma taeanense TaxID=2735870 RepID=A0A6M5Y075_9BACT|nr:glycosyltransferase family 2 protein [Spirosoma taeanense]QJW88187.1 glycosyltransferase family 2 protein [Spirosoma taeanense]
MIYPTLPTWLASHRFTYKPDDVSDKRLSDLRTRLGQFRTDAPEVSIIIPAYNEEESLLNMLSSLGSQQTRYRTELIVSNNNSKDRTQELLDACGVRSLFVTDQGAAFARQAALTAARGKYILNADSDCLYPPGWIDALVDPLQDPAISCTYSTYSFVPSETNPRWALILHETAARFAFYLRRRRGYECVNVMGFSCAFRRKDAMSVGGFNTSFKRGQDIESDDGWMAMLLLKKGRIHRVTSEAGHVWSSDRLLARDGGVLKAIYKRALFEVKRVGWYLRPADVEPASTKP